MRLLFYGQLRLQFRLNFEPDLLIYGKEREILDLSIPES